ncbi:MAG: electron transfer flavoprotein subunit beta/FixA family protein [Lachnospiraceae bacterium]
MKLLGCVKIVPDLEQLSEEDWIVDEKQNIDVSFVKTQWNCFDESALEMMLRLSDLSEGFNVIFELDALTIGREICENYLKTLYALGYEKTVRIECEEELRFWPEMTARLIAEYVSQKGGQDVILMGIQSSVGDNGKTPLLVAEILGWPCITQVIEIEPVDEKYLRVRNTVDGGSVTQTIAIPCVLSVGNTPNSYLRVPTLKDRMKRGKKPIERYSAEELKIKAFCEDTQPKNILVNLKNVSHQRTGILIKGATPEEKAKELYQSYLKGRLKKL